MKASISASIVFLGVLLISATAAKEQVGAVPKLGSFCASEATQIRAAHGLQLLQKMQSGKGTEEQSKPKEPDHAPGCRYRGGEDLQLMV